MLLAGRGYEPLPSNIASTIEPSMLLTLTTTRAPATDSLFCCGRIRNGTRLSMSGFGTAHVLYPEATRERCTAALILDIDPIALVRGRRYGGAEGGLLTQYL